MDIIRHNRFYQAKIDSQGLKSGEKDFINLPNLYVIMITNYDPFGYGYMLYTVRNRCDEVEELEYEDGLRFLYFNTTGTLGGSEELKRFLLYIQHSTQKNVTDDATKKLHDCVSLVKKSPEEKVNYMMWEEKIFYERRDAKEEGRQEGRQAGIQEGRQAGIQEGRQVGVQEGIQRGCEEERLRAISKKLEKHKTEEQIADELELTVEEVGEYVELLTAEFV